MNSINPKLTVTAVVHESGIITAFFNELPGLLVEADNMEGIREKLNYLLKVYIKRLEQVGTDFDIKTQTI